MRAESHKIRKAMGMILILGLVAWLVGWVFTTDPTTASELSRASQAALRQPSGEAQLISVERLPEMDGEMCEWMPASASSSLLASLAQQPRAGARSEERRVGKECRL